MVSDVNLPFSYRFRQDTRLELSLWRELSRQKLWSSVGLGYFTRLEEAFNTGSPPDLSQAFSYNRLFHGPMVRFELSIPPEEVMIGGVRGWRLYAGYDLAPRLLTAVDRGLPSLPLLGFSRYRLGLERDWGPFRLNVGYSEWVTSGFRFEERLRAPGISLTWTTHLP